ncbi:hypothetical protein QGM71_20565 [Virgibacillus sp. C22-A2]|uniref:YiaAB two helix domain-containing protein n=1 Tax=Virgibacillus tibetensis TaxID=3042313 RepID=A0ABU6KL64_9BACI|nr:hypothetical protein [Virgibacillus sp. C22-A2]
MEDKKQSKLEKWRAKYASLVVALGSLYSLIVTWGEGWFFTTRMIIGVLICSTFAAFNLKDSISKQRELKNTMELMTTKN